MVGGDLHWIWEPYGLYQEVDYVRRISSTERGVWALTMSVTFGLSEDRSTVLRLYKKTMDSPALNVSLRSSRWSLDREMLT